MQPYYQTLLHHLLLTTYVFLVWPQLFVLRRSKPQSAVSSLTRPALIQSAVEFFINRLLLLLLLLFKPSPVHSWGCSVSNLCGNQLPVNPGRLVAVTISRSVSKRGLKRMSSGQGCIHTCTRPAEVYQVTAAAPPHSPWATLEVVISLILSHEEEVESIWCCFFVFFFFFFISLWAGFFFLLWNWSTSICQFSSYFDLSSVRRFLSQRVDPSLWWAAGGVVRGISHDELFPRYHVGASTRELDVMDAVFRRNLIWGCVCCYKKKNRPMQMLVVMEG